MENKIYKVNVSDLSVIAGTEHYVITVHEQQSDGIWKLQLEINGLATSSSGTVSEIGSELTGHKIKAYVTGGNQDGNFSIDNLSILSGISKDAQIFQPNIEDSEGKIRDINDLPPFRENGYFYRSTDQQSVYSTINSEGKTLVGDPTKLTGHTVFTGTEQEAIEFTIGALKSGNAINEQDYAYEFPSPTNIFYHTQNSNRTAYTVVDGGLIAADVSDEIRESVLYSINRIDAPGSGESFDLGNDVWNDIRSTHIINTLDVNNSLGSLGYPSYDFPVDVSGNSADYTFLSSATLITLPTVPTVFTGWSDFGTWLDSPFAGGDMNDYSFVVNNSQNHVSPLSFDLDGDGIESNHIYSQTVFFDIDGDGFAEKVGWISPDDGQLAFDVNNNGIIDDITELFGDDKEPAYDKLARFDTNNNGKIDQGDYNYENLLVWRDYDQDGYSDAGELKTLFDTGIKEISLDEIPEQTYQNENYISGRSKYTMFDGTQRDMVDVHFLNDNANTWFQGAQSQEYGYSAEVDPTTLLLPLSRGYGSLPSLHIAMTNNSVLKTMMESIVTTSLEDFGTINTKIEDFLYEWAGVRGNDAEWRATATGNNIDARKVDFLEQFMGVEWSQHSATFVGGFASLGVKKAWSGIASTMKNRILVQSILSDIFPEAQYDLKTDKIILNDSLENIVSKAENIIGTTSTDREVWIDFANILIAYKEELESSVEHISSLVSNVYGEDLYVGDLTLGAVDGFIYTVGEGSEYIDSYVFNGENSSDNIQGSLSRDYISGYSGTDTLHGLDGNDVIRGLDHNDIIYGGDGLDYIEGGDGDDEVHGGNDRDVIFGGTKAVWSLDGVDTIYGNGGDDSLSGGSGADILDGGDGIDIATYGESTTEGVHVSLEAGVGYTGHAKGDILRNIESITGSFFIDTLIGDDNSNYLNGEEGNDTLHGRGGDDHLFGAHGTDKLFGENGDDLLVAFSSGETFNGGLGIDTVRYSHPYNNFGGVTVNLMTGLGTRGIAEGDTYTAVENVIGTAYDDIVTGTVGGNTLQGLSGSDTLHGGSGRDRIYGQQDNDIIYAGNGTIEVDGDHDYVDGGDGNDVIYSGANSTSVNTGDDRLFGGSGEDRIYGQDGDDLLLGGLDNDTLYGDDGNDHLEGGEGNDKLFGNAGEDRIYGQDGNDTIIGYADGDTLNGGKGADTLDYSSQTMRFHIDLENTNVSSVFYRPSGQLSSSGDPATDYDYISGFEHVLLGSGDDYIEGSGTVDNAISNVISGGSGQDNIYGKYGDDILYGDAGQDIIRAGQGDDTVHGGDDLDVLLGHDGNDIMFGDSGNDKMWGNNNDDDLYGGLGNDEIYGGYGIDELYGEAGNDSLSGYNGDDTLYGGYGNDQLFGQLGADTYYGGLGQDKMYSGGNDGDVDTFVFEDMTESIIGSGDERDRIVGFEVGIDKIDLTGIAELATQSVSIVQFSNWDPSIYLLSFSGTDFGVVVTTTGSTLSTSDIIMA